MLINANTTSVSATSSSLVQTSPTERCTSMCDLDGLDCPGSNPSEGDIFHGTLYIKKLVTSLLNSAFILDTVVSCKYTHRKQPLRYLNLNKNEGKGF